MTRTTPLFRLADEYVVEFARLDPRYATYFGVPGFDDLWPDLTPDGRQGFGELNRQMLAKLETAAAQDRPDQRCKEVMTERLRSELAAFDDGDWMRELGSYVGQATQVRSAFDLMRRRHRHGRGGRRGLLRLRLDAAAFLRDRRRGFATLLAAFFAQFLPGAVRQRLFA